MTLPSPHLDDRTFQGLVDEAKRLVQQRCPEWTDHNVSDPGVTLIEAFATMVDQLVYRVNRVPEKSYLTFLDLIGVQLHPPTAAHTEVTFRLSAPGPNRCWCASARRSPPSVRRRRRRSSSPPPSRSPSCRAPSPTWPPGPRPGRPSTGPRS